MRGDLFCVAQASVTLRVCLCLCFECVSQFAGLKSVSRDAERGVCGADQSSTSGAAAARTFCSVPMEDICYQLFISPYTTFFYLTLLHAPGPACACISFGTYLI